MSKSIVVSIIAGLMLIGSLIGCSSTIVMDTEKKVYPGAVGPITSDKKADKKEDEKEGKKVYSGAVGSITSNREEDKEEDKNEDRKVYSGAVGPMN